MIQIDMDMPKSCDDCKIGRFDSDYDFSYCPFIRDGVTRFVNERHPKCPLKEPKLGEWIPVLNQHGETIAYRCSECCTSILLDPRWRYCPFCGVQIKRGERNEID